MSDTAEIEEKAKAQGWRPDFKGENAKSAAQFLEDGNNIAPMQAERNEKLTNEVLELKSDLKGFIDQQHKVTAEARKAGYEKAMAEIKKQKLEAVSEADVEKVKELDREEDKLRKNHASETTEQPKNQDDPDFHKWAPNNKWYKRDSSEKETILADSVGGVLRRTRPELVGPEFYNEVKKQVALVYPHINGKKAVNKLDTSDHTSGSGNTDKRSYSDLPPEAKKACDMQVKKYGIKKEEYVKNYFDMEA